MLDFYGCPGRRWDGLWQLSRNVTLTASGSLAGAVATLGVNGQSAAHYSDGTFATTAGLALRDGNNLFVTAGSNAAGALVLSTTTSNRLPVTVNFGYDLNGNLVGDGQRVFDYNDANELTTITVAGQWKTDFVYDGLGRRRIVREYTNSAGAWLLASESHLVYDRMVVLREQDASNVPRVTYTRGPDLSGTFGGAGGIGGLLARTDGNGSAYYHADAGGNVTLLTDTSGNVVARYLYDPFGRIIGKWGQLADANVMQFSSMPVHRQSGLSLYPFRAYDPNLQRWLNRDPIGELGGLNLYAYVRNSPDNLIDPDGLTWCSNWNFFWSWAFGRGKQNRDYGPNTTETQEMENSPGANKLRNAFYNNGCENINNFGYGTREAAKDTLLHTSQWPSTALQVGGFGGATAINNGDGPVTFTIPNVAGTSSFFYHWVRDRTSSTGPGRSINQTFQWTEPIGD